MSGIRWGLIGASTIAAQHMIVGVQTGRGFAASAIGSARLHAAR